MVVDFIILQFRLLGCILLKSNSVDLIWHSLTLPMNLQLYVTRYICMLDYVWLTLHIHAANQ